MIVAEPKVDAREFEIATNNWELLRANDTPARQSFEERFDSDTAFYFHQQFTKEEKERKGELKQLDQPIDRVRPIIRRIVAKIVKNKPVIAALTADFNAIDLSRRVNAQVQYAMRISKGLSQIRRCLMNSVRGGLGYLEVFVDNMNKRGELEVKFKYLSPKNVYVDFASKDILFDDARNIQVIEKVMLTDAIKMFPDDPDSRNKLILSAGTSFKDEIIVDDENAAGKIVIGSTIEQSFDQDDFIDRFNQMENDGVIKINGWVEILRTYRKIAKITRYGKTVDKNGNLVRFKLNDNEEVSAAKKNKEIKIEYAYDTLVHEQITTPQYLMREQEMEWIESYPIVPMMWEDTENPYPISETFFIKGHQRLQNKYYEIILLNAQTTSMATLWYETGALANPTKAMNDLASPGAPVEFMEGALSQKKAQFVYGTPLNQAFFTLYEQLKHEQEVQASAFNTADPTMAPETNKALLNLDSMQDRPLAINIDAVEASLERVFKLIIEFQSVTYVNQKLLLIDTDPENNMMVNEPETRMDGDEIVIDKVYNDISKIDYDLQLVPSSMSPLDRTSEYQYAREAVELGVPPEFALKKMPVVGIEKAIKDMDTVRQLSQENAKLMEMLEQFQKEFEKLQSEAERYRKTAIDENYKNKFDIQLTKLQSLYDTLKRETRNFQRKNQQLERKQKQNITARSKETAEKKE